MSLARTSRLIAVLAAAGGLAASPAIAGAHNPKHHTHRFPQHNGGDHDADNNGGRSDGDGNV